MDVLHDLLTNLGETRVQDVHIPGFLETEYGHPRFVALSNTIYLDLGARFLRLDTAIGSGVLALTVVAAMTPPPDLDREDEEFMTASIGDLFFDAATRCPSPGSGTPSSANRPPIAPVVRCRVPHRPHRMSLLRPLVAERDPPGRCPTGQPHSQAGWP